MPLNNKLPYNVNNKLFRLVNVLNVNDIER